MGTAWHTDREDTEEAGVYRINENHCSVILDSTVETHSAAEAVELAMRCRDAIDMAQDTNVTLTTIDAYWHIHHPWGC